MKYGGKTLIGLLCFAALNGKAAVNDSPSSVGSETSTERPYSAIWLRNVFDLKPVPPPPAEPVKASAPPPNVHLTGISTLGEWKAMFMVQAQPIPGKPPSKDEPYSLRKNERQGQLEVLDINPDAKTVKIDLAGVVSTVTFETNRPTSGGPGGPGRGPQPPAFTPAGMPNPGNGAIPPRYLRTDVSTPQAQNNYGQPNAYGQPANGYGTGFNGSTYNNQTQNNQAANPGLSLEESLALLKINKAILAPQIEAGTVPPLPVFPGESEPTGTPNTQTPTTPVNKPTYPPGFGPRSSGTLR